MKEVSLVFLEKSELQHRSNSVLIEFFSTPSILESQTNMFQLNYFSQAAACDSLISLLTKKGKTRTYNDTRCRYLRIKTDETFITYSTGRISSNLFYKR